MKNALVVDWGLAQTLFAQGLTAKMVVQRLNIPGLSLACVQQRAKRGKWARLRDASKDVLVSASRTVLGDERDRLAKASAQARNGLSDEVLGQLAHLGSLKRSKSLESTATRSQIVRTVAETGKLVYGWDADSARRTIINVALMEMVGAGHEQPAIDVEASQVADVAPTVAPTADPLTPA